MNFLAALAVTGATLYGSPTSAPIPDAVVLMQGGRIVAAGPRDTVTIPSGTTVLDARNMFLVAGFQNSHVHFTEDHWERAERRRASELGALLTDLALRWGFTTVFDTGSGLANTNALRLRIEKGEIPGPRILTTGIPFYPVDGIPYYLKTLPPEIQKQLNMPRTPEEAAAIAARQIEAGADAVKLFTGSGRGRGLVTLMEAPIARAAVDEAHRRGKPSIAHGSTMAGLEVALEARVDILAHALDDVTPPTPAHLARMKANGMALIPTLKLFGHLPHIRAIQQQVRDYERLGGQILFGTDVGFLPDTNPAAEYALMAGAGLDWRAILASLTTAPAERFGEGARRGRVAAGMDADLVVLAADPAADPAAFAKVRHTIRGGQVVFTSP